MTAAVRFIIAIRQKGNFPESMTNGAPGLDSAVESNIYCRQFKRDQRYNCTMN